MKETPTDKNRFDAFSDGVIAIIMVVEHAPGSK